MRVHEDPTPTSKMYSFKPGALASCISERVSPGFALDSWCCARQPCEPANTQTLRSLTGPQTKSTIACIHAYIRIYIYVYLRNAHAYMQTGACMHAVIHICTHTCACIYIYIHTCIHIRTYIRTSVHVYMHTCIHAYIRTCVHLHIPTYVTCIHIDIHTYIHTGT